MLEGEMVRPRVVSRRSAVALAERQEMVAMYKFVVARAPEAWPLAVTSASFQALPLEDPVSSASKGPLPLLAASAEWAISSVLEDPSGRQRSQG